MHRELLMSRILVDMIFMEQSKLKRYCAPLFRIPGWKGSKRFIYNHYLASGRHADKEVCLYGEGTFNSELYNGKIQYKIASRARSLVRGNFCRSVRTKKTCPISFFGRVLFSFFLGKYGEGKSRSAKIFTPDSWDNGTFLPFASRSINIMKKDGAIILSPALLYTFCRDKFWRVVYTYDDAFISSNEIRWIRGWNIAEQNIFCHVETY